MLCTRCGNSVSPFQKFCPECGQAASPGVSPSVPLDQYRTQDPVSGGLTESTKLILIVGCLVLSVLAVVVLHAYAASLAVVCIAVGGFTVLSKRISTRNKLYAAGVALTIVLTVNALEGWQQKREQQRQAEIARQQEAERAAEAKRREEAFRAMSLEEHLTTAKSLLNLNAPPASVNEALKHLGAIPQGAPQAKEGARIKKQYDQAKRLQAEQAAKAQAAAAKRRAAEKAATNRKLRDLMAAHLERNMLSEGISADVKAIGPDHTTLQFKYVLATKALAYQMGDSGFIEEARRIGFKRFEVTDGIDQTWYFELD